MFVVDSSLIVDVLTTTDFHDVFRSIIRGEAVAPHLLDLEVVQGLRRAFLEKRLTDQGVRDAIGDLASLPIERYSHEGLIGRIWEVRQNITTYDASYVALAEHLDFPLLTRDRRLADSSGHAARIRYIDASNGI